jgi:hypothetical protein
MSLILGHLKNFPLAHLFGNRRKNALKSFLWKRSTPSYNLLKETLTVSKALMGNYRAKETLF